MNPDCLPIAAMPHVTRLYQDYLAMGSPGQVSALPLYYGADPAGDDWMLGLVPPSDSKRLAALLTEQAAVFGAGPQALANIARLGAGARAVVTGQQVGLFGGPLLTLLKAATAIACAAQAEKATGIPHVPVFWLATEDHDLAEVDQVVFPGQRQVETLHLDLKSTGREVGTELLGNGVEALLDRVRELTAYAPIVEALADCYRPERTLGEAFARWMTKLFAGYGLIVMDASGRQFHALGERVLRAAIAQADDFEAALLARSAALEQAGYHAQVLVKPGASNLFLIDAVTGERHPLRRTGDIWRAGGQSLSTADLLKILESAPERLSPNALLRPVLQDAILPTAAYIGGPAEIAYFAQSAVLYQRILGRITPVLPRFSATLVEPRTAAVCDRHEVLLQDLFPDTNAEMLAQRLGARSMPVETKRKLSSTGVALDEELTALTTYMAGKRS